MYRVSKAAGSTSGPELLILPEHLRSFSDFKSVVRVAQSFSFLCIIVDNCLFVLFHLAISVVDGERNF